MYNFAILRSKICYVIMVITFKIRVYIIQHGDLLNGHIMWVGETQLRRPIYIRTVVIIE